MELTVIDCGTVKGLPMKRLFRGFTASKVSDSVEVEYEEYLETPSGDKVEWQVKSYIVKNYPAVTHQEQEIIEEIPQFEEDGITPKMITVTDKEASTRFTIWYSQLGAVISSAVNSTLIAIPTGVPEKIIL